MGAMDLFEGFTGELKDETRRALQDFIRAQRADLLAARSEDARVRMVNEYIERVKALVSHSRR